MMLSRVATFPQTNQMLNAAMQTESVMANGQMQEETGMVSMDYGGLGGQTSKQFINLQISVERSQSYMDAANSVDNKLQAMTTATTQMSDLLTNLRTTLTAASNAGNTDYSSLQQSGQQMLQQMASLLNTKYNGQYLFGGAQTGSPPVDASSSNYPPATTPSSPDTSYYKGDDQVASVRVSDTEVVSYGVTADNPAFEQAMRAMNLVASTNPLSAAGITEALNLAQQAVTGVSEVQTSVGLASSSVEAASSNQSDYKSFAQSLGSDLTGVDVAAVTAQMSSYQAQLTAAFTAISKIQGMNLASYLR